MMPSGVGAIVRKELAQIGSRRQIFLARTLYAAVLFVCFGVFFFQEYARPGRDPFAVLGRGKALLDFLVAFQFAAIYLFLPALMAGAIAEEKERDSLFVLLLTRLRPREVLIGKLAGRLVPVLTMLFLSLPPMAIAYAYGGVSPDGLALAFFFLAVACFQVGSVSLACSALCRRATIAFLASCAAIAALQFALPAGAFVARAAGLALPPAWDADLVWAFFPVFLFLDTRYDAFADGVARGVPAVASGALCLVLARFFLIRRAHPVRGGRMQRAFDRVARLGGVLRGRRSPPGDAPVAWREARRVWLGERRYRVAAVTAVALAALAAALLARTAAPAATGDIGAFSILVLVLWGSAILATVVRAVDLVAGERSRGTLELLLAAPIRGEELILQKMEGIRRLRGVLWVPFLIVFAVEAWTESTAGISGPAQTAQSACALVSSALSVAVFLPLAAWVSAWVGLKVRGRVRAALAALLATAAFGVVPTIVWVAFPFAFKLKEDPYLGPVLRALAVLAFPIVIVVLIVLGLAPLPSLTFTHPLHIALVSPVTAVWATEYAHSWIGGAGTHAALWIAIGLNLLVHAAIRHVVRSGRLEAADRYLGRM